MVGTEIGNYRILEKLGEGGMGVVYKAVDVNLDRTVAIKALNAELTGNPELEQRFRAEAKAQANLNHTNLATLYTLLIEDGRPWMVMEYIEGENFEQMVQRRGPIPALEAIPMFRQALLGIGYAHRMGIVHRDIKPSNMMLNRHGIVKVMDFGIAKVLGSRGLTRTGTQMGTAFYMSPEQVLNQSVDIRSDIYSLGVTLYEMLTANVPFGGDSDYRIMTDHVNTPPPLPTRFYPYIPKGVENAVLKAMEKNPDARFQTVEEFGAALEHPDDFVAVPAVAVAAPAAAVAQSPPVVAGAVVAQALPPKTSFWTPERKIVAGGAGVVLALVAGWLAFRPAPKPTGAPIQTGRTASGPIAPSGGGEVRDLSVPKVVQPADQTGGASNKGQSKTPSGEPSKPSGKEPEKREAAPKPVRELVIPAGTLVSVRLIDAIDSRQNQPGEKFDASVDSPVVAGGRTVIPKGANARVVLASVNQAGHIAGRSELVLRLASVSIHGKSYPVASDTYVKLGSSRGKRSAEVIGGAAAVGAVIGGIFGHKKGAAGGAAAGAGAGTATQYATKGQPVTIASETHIDFTLRGPINVSQAP